MAVVRDAVGFVVLVPKAIAHRPADDDAREGGVRIAVAQRMTDQAAGGTPENDRRRVGVVMLLDHDMMSAMVAVAAMMMSIAMAVVVTTVVVTGPMTPVLTVVMAGMARVGMTAAVVTTMSVATTSACGGR